MRKNKDLKKTRNKELYVAQIQAVISQWKHLF